MNLTLNSVATPKILLLEDNPQNRALLVLELQKEFGNVCICDAANQVELDEHLRQGAFELVLTDCQLLWTSGIQVLEAVKERDRLCPVVMLTSGENDEIANLAIDKGLDGYLFNDVCHPGRLLTAVRAMLDRAALRREQELLVDRLDGLLKRLEMGLYRRQLDGTLIRGDDQFRRLLGVSLSEDLAGMDFFGMFRDAERLRQQAAQQLREQPVWESKARRKTFDGEAEWLALNERVLKTSGGLVVAGMLEDVTEQRLAEEALLLSHSELSNVARLSAIEELVAGIAHEINQPLAAISNYSQACAFQLEKIEHPRASDLRQWLSTIGDEANRTADIVRGFQRLIEDCPPVRETVSLNSAVRTCLHLLAAYLHEARVTVTVDRQSDQVRVSANKVQLLQVLANLLRNACDSMAEIEVPKRQIQITTGRRGHQVFCAVADHGRGIAPEQLDHLFDPFFTTKTAGTGIGLAVCRRIIQAHGGEISGYNTADGATFDFTLPVDQNEVG